MAEMPRELFSATSPEGDPLSPGAKLVLAYLWTFVDAAEATRYRGRTSAARAPRVTCDAEAIASLFHFDADSVQRHLRALRESGYAVRHHDDPDNKLALLDAKHRDEYLKVVARRA